MATIKELETIEFIKKRKEEAKENGEDIPSSLSNGKEYFRKAISAMSSSGVVTLVTSICVAVLSFAVKILEYVSKSQYYTINYGFMIGEFIGILIVTVIPMIIGIKLLKVDSTPRFVLGLLIASLVFNLIFCAGIIPLISLVFNIIALVSWSTYKTWFYSLKK